MSIYSKFVDFLILKNFLHKKWFLEITYLSLLKKKVGLPFKNKVNCIVPTRIVSVKILKVL